MSAYQRLYFGEKWDGPSHDGATQTETPVGEACYMCDRAMEEGDQGWIRPLLAVIKLQRCALFTLAARWAQPSVTSTATATALGAMLETCG